MSRAIYISTDVFQAIWLARKPGQETEDEILRGVFGLGAPTNASEPEVGAPKNFGFQDSRYKVRLETGFTIFRTYKGKHHVAKAIEGCWHMNGVGYPTLNELNKAIGVAGAENAWQAWQYSEPSGRRRPLSSLRDQSTIVRRRI